MGCYLCVYDPQAVPAGKPRGRFFSFPRGEEVGTCARCSVAACTAHGARRAQFECAICEPGRATESVLLSQAEASPSGGAAAALAHSVGAAAADGEQDRVRRALEIINQHARERGPERGDESLAAPSHERRPNLLTNLAGVIREQGAPLRGEEAELGLIPKVQRERRSGDIPQDAVSIEEISAAVAATFAGAEVNFSSTQTAVEVVHGAVLLAMSTADARNPSHPPGSYSTELNYVEVLPPWRVTHPVLLDPVMWMVLTAYQLA